MQRTIFGLPPNEQSKYILAFGIGLTLIIFYGLTNHFQGVAIPEEYKVLNRKTGAKKRTQNKGIAINEAERSRASAGFS